MDTIIELSAQWTNPSDVTTVLMVIGGDVVQKALAQRTGTLYVPVCFSFGWVSFAFVALVNVLGDGRLLPAPDYPAKIFNLQSGYVRENKNWLIGRILRDHERSMWRTHGLYSSGVRITVFDAIDRPSPGKGLFSKILRPKEAVNRHPFSYGWTHLWGFLITLIQLGIAAIPIALDRDWGVMLVTAGGTLLALAFGAIPQWTVEKLPSRMRSRSVFALTSGNGSKDIMVIRGLGKCWDLEDFAALDSPRNARAWETFNLLRAVPEATAGRDPTFPTEAELGGGAGFGLRRASTTTTAFGTRRSSFVEASRDFRGVPMGFVVTMVVTIAQSVLWLLLLITVAALKANTWYLVAVGGLGMFQNAILAAMTRPSDRRGLFLKRVDEIVTRKVMDGLMDLETEYGCGQPLVGEFFSGKLQAAEDSWWRGERQEYDMARRKDPSRGIPRSYLTKHRPLTSSTTSSVASEAVPSASPGLVEMTGAIGATAATTSSMSPSAPVLAPPLPHMQPAMASIRPERTRSVTFERRDGQIRAKDGNPAALRMPIKTMSTSNSFTAARSGDGEEQTAISPPRDTSASDGGDDSPRSSIIEGGGYGQVIQFPVEYLADAVDSQFAARDKGKGREKPNPFDDLKPNPL